jgi:hypothetical protein
MKAILQDEGHTVYTVEKGNDAVQFIKSNGVVM